MPIVIVEIQTVAYVVIPPNLPPHCGMCQSTIAYFSQFSPSALIKPHPTPICVRHEVFAVAREGMLHSAIVGCMGLTRATVNRILYRHAGTGTLVPGKSMGAAQKTTNRQDHALLRMVRQDRFICAWALTAQMRNLYGMKAGQKTINNRLLCHGYHAYRPARKPLLIADHHGLP